MRSSRPDACVFPQAYNIMGVYIGMPIQEGGSLC